MDIQWQESIQIERPVEQVYAYLADFPRHAEWAQTLARLQQKRPGDQNGLGAQYLTFERQAMQADRKPGQILRKGLPVKTLCEVHQLIPNRRIAWHARTVPKTGLYSECAFEFAPADGGGTQLTQHITFHQPGPLAFLFRLIFGKDVRQKGQAQWAAGLRNIKTILEQDNGRPPHNGSSAV